MMKWSAALLLLSIAITPAAFAQDGVYHNGRKVDAHEFAEIQRQAERERRVYTRRSFYIYNGDDRPHIGYGIPPSRYNYNRSSTYSGDMAVACNGLRERQHKRCLEDAAKAQEKLIRKYRN